MGLLFCTLILINCSPKVPTKFEGYGEFYDSIDPETSIIFYTNIINNNPNEVKAYYSRGLAYLKNSEFEKALKDFDKAIELSPNFLNAYMNRGNVYIHQNRLSDALRDFNFVIENNDYAALFINRAILYRILGEYDKAIEDYNIAQSLQPKRASIYNNRGILYNIVGKYDLAISDYKKAIKLDSEYSAPYYGLACCYSKKNEKIKALSFLELAIQKGYKDFEHMANDSDLDNIREEEKFKEIFSKHSNQ